MYICNRYNPWNSRAASLCLHWRLHSTRDDQRERPSQRESERRLRRGAGRIVVDPGEDSAAHHIVIKKQRSLTIVRKLGA
jgi:hypothetical protein